MPTRAERYLMDYGPPPGYGGGYGYDRGGYGTLQGLLMERGRLQAEAAMRSGELWANTLSNVGNQISTGLQQQAEAKKKKTRDDAYLNLMQDPKAFQDPRYAFQQFLKIGGPEDGSRMFQAYAGGLQLMQPQRDPEKDQKAAAAAIKGLESLTPENRAKVWGPLAPAATKVFGDHIPQQYDDKTYSEILLPWAKSMSGPGKLTEVSPGATVVDESGKGVFTAPAKPEKPPEVSSLEAYTRGKYGPSPTPDQVLAARKAYGQADDRARITVNTGTQLSPTAESNIINRLSTQWTKASGTVAELSRQSKIMEAGLDAARRGDMASGSQAVLVTFQKILDPESVVRESEYARSGEGQALLARAEGAFDRLTKGGAGVPLSELEKFKTLADDIIRNSSGRLNAIKERLGKTADRYKVPRELIFEDFDMSGGNPAAPAAPGGGPARPSSKADYDKLPSGTPYIAPDGSMRVKP